MCTSTLQQRFSRRRAEAFAGGCRHREQRRHGPRWSSIDLGTESGCDALASLEPAAGSAWPKRPACNERYVRECRPPASGIVLYDPCASATGSRPSTRIRPEPPPRTTWPDGATWLCSASKTTSSSFRTIGGVPYAGRRSARYHEVKWVRATPVGRQWKRGTGEQEVLQSGTMFFSMALTLLPASRSSDVGRSGRP